MPVEVAQQCVYNKHLPEMPQQPVRFYKLLFFYGVKNIGKLRSAPVAVRIKDGIFDGTKVKKLFSICGKIPAGTDNFCLPCHVEGSRPYQAPACSR